METTPYETEEQALEGRVRSMGFFSSQVAQLAGHLAAVRQTISDMEDSGFPSEYQILEPVKALEVSAAIRVEPKIKDFLEAYTALLEVASAPAEEPETS